MIVQGICLPDLNRSWRHCCLQVLQSRTFRPVLTVYLGHHQICAQAGTQSISKHIELMPPAPSLARQFESIPLQLHPESVSQFRCIVDHKYPLLLTTTGRCLNYAWVYAFPMLDYHPSTSEACAIHKHQWPREHGLADVQTSSATTTNTTTNTKLLLQLII